MPPESEGFYCSGATQHILDYSSFQILLFVLSQSLLIDLGHSIPTSILMNELCV